MGSGAGAIWNQRTTESIMRSCARRPARDGAGAGHRPGAIAAKDHADGGPTSRTNHLPVKAALGN